MKTLTLIEFIITDYNVDKLMNEELSIYRTVFVAFTLIHFRCVHTSAFWPIYGLTRFFGLSLFNLSIL